MSTGLDSFRAQRWQQELDDGKGFMMRRIRMVVEYTQTSVKKNKKIQTHQFKINHEFKSIVVNRG